MQKFIFEKGDTYPADRTYGFLISITVAFLIGYVPVERRLDVHVASMTMR
jgi:hypothetical protein